MQEKKQKLYFVKKNMFQKKKRKLFKIQKLLFKGK